MYKSFTHDTKDSRLKASMHFCGFLHCSFLLQSKRNSLTKMQHQNVSFFIVNLRIQSQAALSYSHVDLFYCLSHYVLHISSFFFSSKNLFNSHMIIGSNGKKNIG